MIEFFILKVFLNVPVLLGYGLKSVSLRAYLAAELVILFPELKDLGSVGTGRHSDSALAEIHDDLVEFEDACLEEGVLLRELLELLPDFQVLRSQVHVLFFELDTLQVCEATLGDGHHIL
jgi:hypothetical protein